MSVNEKMTALADEIRELSGTTTTKSIDAMTTDVNVANTEIAEQAELLEQIATALEGKASGGGEDVTDETNAYTTKLASLENAVAALENELEGKASGGNASSMISFIITPSFFDSTYLTNVNSYIATEGMTWSEWMESDFNTLGCIDADGYPAIEVEIMGSTSLQHVVILNDKLDVVYSNDQIINNQKYTLG